MSGFIPTLPYYEVKRGLTSENKTMRLESATQQVDAKRLKFICDGIANIQNLFYELTNYPNILDSIPNIAGRKVALFSEAQRNNMLYPPISPLARMDVVGGKVVDINTKPSGFGLISSAEIVWCNKDTYSPDSTPIKANYNRLQMGNYDSFAVITESGYPFVSDQIAFARIAERETGKAWRVVFCDKDDLQFNSNEGIYCFSWLSSEWISPRWRDWLFDNQERFILNPLAGVWDNKALLALPFLELESLNSKLVTQILKTQRVLPETYLFRKTPAGLEMAVEINQHGIEFQKVNKFNTPTIGEVYIKPLLESGSRGVIVKNLMDGGTSKNTLLNYSQRYDSFIVQKKIKPEKINDFEIKDGYFVDFQQNTRLITIERMGVRVPTDLIHGGSSSLIPVSIPYSEN